MYKTIICFSKNSFKINIEFVATESLEYATILGSSYDFLYVDKRTNVCFLQEAWSNNLTIVRISNISIYKINENIKSDFLDSVSLKNFIFETESLKNIGKLDGFIAITFQSYLVTELSDLECEDSIW